MAGGQMSEHIIKALLEQNDELKARVKELTAALKPFTIELLPSHNVYGCEMVFVKPEELAAARKVLGS
jgi:hypothetical protein